MPRQSQQQRIEKALTAAAKALGVETEDLDVKRDDPEHLEDKMLDAQAVVDYFTKSKGFKEIPCRECGMIFAYNWYFDGIKYCSPHCLKLSLEKIGIVWDLERPAARRWSQSRPAIIPPPALEILKQIMPEKIEQSSPVLSLVVPPEDPPPDTTDGLLALLLG